MFSGHEKSPPKLNLPGKFDPQARYNKLAKGMDMRRLASVTAGFSDAELEHVLNEATLLTARCKAKRGMWACCWR